MQACVLQPSSWRDGAYALCGVKPLVDSYRVVTGAPLPAGQRWPAEFVLCVARVAQVVCECLPQALLQGYVALSQSAPVAPLQWVSLAASCVATAYVLALAGYDIDTSPQSRRAEPALYGMYPTGASLSKAVVESRRRRSAAMLGGARQDFAEHFHTH